MTNAGLLGLLVVILGSYVVAGENIANVIGGKIPDREDAGWSVNILPNWCGGTLLNRRWVLTTATCLGTIAPEYLSVIFGSHDIRTDEYDIKNGVKAIIHPNFTDTTENNVALLKIKGVAKVGSKYIAHIDDLATPEIYEEIRAKDRRCFVYGDGWKQNADGRFVPNYELKKVSMRYIDCKNEFEDWSSTMDCIRTNERGDKLCDEDGHALVCRYQGRWYQTGLYSHSSKLNGCRSGYYGVMNVAQHLPWIMDTVNNN